MSILSFKVINSFTFVGVYSACSVFHCIFWCPRKLEESPLELEVWMAMSHHMALVMECGFFRKVVRAIKLRLISSLPSVNSQHYKLELSTLGNLNGIMCDLYVCLLYMG